MFREEAKSRRELSRRNRLEHDVFALDPKVREHLDDGVIHHGRPTDVVLAVLRRRVVLEVVVVQDLVDEASHARPIVFLEGFGKSKVPLKVFILFFNGVEVFDIERLAHAARAVPEADLAIGVNSAELIENVRAHRGHSGTPADENHLIGGIASVKLTVRTRDHHFVARL